MAGFVPTPTIGRSDTSMIVRDFGAVGDGISDDTEAIQACIDAAIYGGRSHRIFLPEGRYRISDTIHVGYGVLHRGTPFTSALLQGSGSAYRGEASFSGTVLLPSFRDRPALAIQGGRRVRIRGIAIRGSLYEHIQPKMLGDSKSEMDDVGVEVWLPQDLPASSRSRHAPFAGICVDPYSGKAPQLSYPKVNYPSWLGEVDQYEKAYTSDVLLDDIHLSGFVVGVVVQPSDADGNGDFVSIRDSSIEFCAYGVSIGNSQSRQNNLFNVNVASCHTAITNNKHGREIGKIGGAFVGCSFDRCIQLFDISSSYSGPVVFEGCYAELLWRFGSLGSAAARNAPVTVQGCEFRLSYQPSFRGVPASYADGGGGILFSGGTLQIPAHMHFLCAAAFEGTTIDCTEISGGRASYAMRVAHEWSLDTTVPFRELLGAPNQIIGNVHGTLRPGLQPSTWISSAQEAGGRTRPLSRLCTRVYWPSPTSGSTELAVPRSPVYQFGKNTVAVTFHGIQAIFSIQEQIYGIGPGDLFEDPETGTIFLVESSQGPRVTARALNNTFEVGGQIRCRKPPDTITGVWFVAISRLYATSLPLVCDAVSSSREIQNLRSVDGQPFSLGELRVGDYLLENPGPDQVFEQGNQVTDLDLVRGSIIMKSGALRTTSCMLPFWIRG